MTDGGSAVGDALLLTPPRLSGHLYYPTSHSISFEVRVNSASVKLFNVKYLNIL